MTNTVTVLGTQQTFELPENISVHEHNWGQNINICDTNAKDGRNGLGIVFSVCTRLHNKEDLAEELTKGLLQVGAKPLKAHA